MPKVSIIIPTYNHVQHLPKALKSIAAQTFQDFEVIIIDDGSTDSTRVTVQKHLNGKFSYFYQDNKGPAAARNTGIKKAKGEFIAFMDSDDIWMAQKLKLQVERLEQNKEHTFVYSDFVYFLNNNLCHKRYLLEKGFLPCTQSDKLFDELLNLKNYFIYPSTVMLRQYIFDEVGLFDERLHIGEDWDMWLRILKRFPKMEVIEEPLIERYMAQDNLSMNKEKINTQLIHLKTEYLKRTDFLNDRQKQSFRREIKTHHYELGYLLMCQKNNVSARKHFLKSLNSSQFLKPFIYTFRTFIPVSWISIIKKIKQPSPEH